MKTCSKCNFTGKDEFFVKASNCCKKCKSIYKKEYDRTHKKENKEYHENNKNKIAITVKKYQKEHRTKIEEYKKEYNKEHKEEHSEYNKNYWINNKEKLLENSKQYRKNNKEKLAKYYKEYRKNNPNIIVRQKQKWYKTSNGKESKSKSKSKRRLLGYSPINKWFKNSHFHHMHLYNNNAIGLYIPSKLHTSISHNSYTGEGLAEINKAALLWLCDQSIINGDEKNGFIQQQLRP